tara:strand:- start:37 stop:606 length:570 start_codon:yes stop_codon:yes gene_type:complete
LYLIKFYIVLIFFSILFSSANDTHTESWYFNFGTGSSTVSEATDTIPGFAYSRAYDMGFYWHYKLNTLFGIGLVGKGEKVIDRNLDLEKEVSVFVGPSFNMIHFKDHFGKGIFYRLALGLSQRGYEVQKDGEKIIDRPEDIGIGFLFGGGYSFDYKGKSRYMMGIYLGTSILDDDSIESYVNVVLNGLW